MLLKTLLHGLELPADSLPEMDIPHIAYDSRQVRPGSLFVAIRGAQSDGHDYIPAALERGARAVLCELSYPGKREGVLLKVPDSRRALARISKNFHDSPTQAMKTIGITGTNGKTTISYLIEALLKEAGFSPAVVGTINYRHAGQVFPSTHTTPESLDLDAFLAARRAEGCDALVMEVSSHAIAQHRVDGIEFDAAIFTNLTPDHLDYHQNLENYFAAKARLFTELLPASPKKQKTAILNLDDARVAALRENLALTVYGVSLSREDADFFPLSKKISLQGIEARIQTPRGSLSLKSPLMGEYNLFNLMAALAAGFVLGLDLELMGKSLGEFGQVPGRLERVENRRGLHVFVDYAHTPDALKNVLETLRKLLQEARSDAKILTVFGCGGDRDKAKRPLMGREVSQLSDLAVLTSDNPRTEDPLAILNDVKPGLEACGGREGQNFWVEADRKRGIGLALSKARAGDIVLIAGKGHEDYQILGKQKIHFDDREVAREFLH